MWFTPPVALLHYSTDLWPLGEKWRENHADLAVVLALGLLNFLYVSLAVVGAWPSRAQPGLALLIGFVAIRTAFMTQLQTVEPRYVIACFPAMLAIGAQAWAFAPQFRGSPASDRHWAAGDAAAD
jgi:hypothetical protein